MLAAPDKVSCAKMLVKNGVDFVIVRTGFDDRHETPEASPLDELEKIVKAVNIPVKAVGGLSIEQAVRMPEYRASLVVIGAPLVIDDDAFKAAHGDLASVLKEVVQRVKAYR